MQNVTLKIWTNDRVNVVAYFVKGSITVQLTSCLTGLDLTKQVSLLSIQHEQSSCFLTSKTGGQPYSDTSPLWSKWVFSGWNAWLTDWLAWMMLKFFLRLEENSFHVQYVDHVDGRKCSHNCPLQRVGQCYKTLLPKVSVMKWPKCDLLITKHDDSTGYLQWMPYAWWSWVG